MSLDELDEIKVLLKKENNSILFVGFNRRFSRFSSIIKSQLIKSKQPISINMQINADKIPSTHWLLDRKVGG